MRNPIQNSFSYFANLCRNWRVYATFEYQIDKSIELTDTRSDQCIDCQIYSIRNAIFLSLFLKISAILLINFCQFVHFHFEHKIWSMRAVRWYLNQGMPAFRAKHSQFLMTSNFPTCQSSFLPKRVWGTRDRRTTTRSQSLTSFRLQLTLLKAFDPFYLAKFSKRNHQSKMTSTNIKKASIGF